jgi:hypothetical protein
MFGLTPILRHILAALKKYYRYSAHNLEISTLVNNLYNSNVITHMLTITSAKLSA